MTAARVGSVTPQADADMALLRRLVGDTATPQRYTDAELAVAAAAVPPCQGQPDRDGVWPDPRPDLYEAAARLWEDRALHEEATGTAQAEEARVTSERNGDVSRTYGGAGRATGAAVLTPERMRAMARQLRKRSCNAGARTVEVLTQFGRREVPVRGNLYPSQLVN